MIDPPIPKTWAHVDIEQLLQPQSDGKLIHQGWSPQCLKEPAQNSEWGVLKTTAIQDGRFLEDENKKLPSEKDPKSRIEVKDNDLLITNAGPRSRCGIVALVRKTRAKLMISGKMYRMRFHESLVDARFVEAYLRTSHSQEAINTIKTGISESGLNMTQSRFKALQVAIAPFAEQKQIATKLDELLAQVDTVKTRLDAIPAILKRFRQSVLAAAVSGKLTEEWRNARPEYDAAQQIENIKSFRVKQYKSLKKSDKKSKRQANAIALDIIPPSWSYSHIDPFLSIDRPGMKTGPFGSLLKKYEHTDNGVPVLGIENIDRGIFVEGSKIHISQRKAEELNTYDIRCNDLIISRSGSVGDICVIPNNLGVLRFSTNIMRLSFLEGSINPHFFSSLFLGSPIVLRQVAELCKGSTRLFLNQKILFSVNYPIPPIEEQTEIVRRVDQLFAHADIIEQRLKDAQTRVDQLTQSILAKAFRGDLTADWRAQNPQLISGDHSAQALLERIKLERAKLKPGKRRRSKQAASS